MNTNKLECIDNTITSYIPFYEYVCSKCKKGYYNMLLYRHLGDTYVMAGLKNDFEKHYKAKLHYLVKPSQEIILKQFGITEYTIVDLDRMVRNRLQHSKRTREDIDWLEEELYVKLFTSLPIKDVPFLGSHIRIVREVLKWDNFVNAWAKMFGLDVHRLDVAYYVPELSERLKRQLKKLPPVERLVLLAPETNSFGMIREEYWHKIILKYRKRGYTVVTNCQNSSSRVQNTINLDLQVSDVIALGMRCHEVHSIRSGLCDILAAKEDRLFVYYTQEMLDAYPKNYLSLNHCYHLSKPVNEIFVPVEPEKIRIKIKKELDTELGKVYQYTKRYVLVRKINHVWNKTAHFGRKISEATMFLWKVSRRIHRGTFRFRSLIGIVYALDRCRDPLDMRITQLGKDNANKIIFYIRLPEWWVPTAGFFALLHKTLCAVSFADRMGMEIVVGNWDNCVYEVDPCITGTDKVFEYYFEPLSNISEKSAMQSKNVCFSELQNIDLILKECKMENWFVPTKRYIQRMAFLYRKYIRLNSRIQEIMEQDIHSVLQEKKTLGIHYRGTDYCLNCNGHPVSATIEDYITEIKTAYEKQEFDQIFIATDDKGAIKRFQDEFLNVTYYQDVYRSTGNTSVVYADDYEKPDGYMLGYQVLRDAYTLAACSGLIGGQSQVCYGTQIMKAARNETFEYLKIIDKGINHNKKDWINVYKKMQGSQKL